MDNLGRRLGQHLTDKTEGIPAELGILNDDRTYTVRVENTNNEVYARLFGDSNRVITAINLKTDYRPRLPVRVKRNRSGRYEVIDADPNPVDAFLGESAPTANIPPLQGELVNMILPGDKFKPGRVRSLNGTDLQIKIEAFPYGEIELGNVDYDLATDVATLSADTKAWFVITVDQTNTVDVIKGNEEGLALTLTSADAFEIAIPAGQIALWAFILADTYTVLPIKPLKTDALYETDMRVMMRPGLTVQEVDGSPAIKNVHTLIFNNGTVTDNSDGSATIDNSGGGGSTNLSDAYAFAWFG